MKSIGLSILLGIFFFGFLIFLSLGSDPTSGLYNFKRFYEKGVEYTKRTPEQKAEYYSKLLDKRLDEIKRINDKQEYFLLLSASLRYSTTAGNLTDVIVSNRLIDNVPPTQEKFKSHEKQLTTIINNFESTDDNLNFLVDTVNYIHTYNKRLEDLK